MRRPERRFRKQRVVLRERRRTAIAQHLRRFIRRSAIVALVGLSIHLAMRHAPAVQGFVQRHTPEMQIQASEQLSSLPLAQEVPASRLTLWLPGAECVLAKRWMAAYPAIGAVHLERHFFENRLIAHIEARMPLVRWETNGVDASGIVFPLASVENAATGTLPKASFLPNEPLPDVARWLSQLARVSPLWSQVVAVTENPHGTMYLETQRGTHVVWGPAEVAGAAQKARYLAWVLDDAHARMGGAKLADLRFFDEGRIVVQPKSIARMGSEG